VTAAEYKALRKRRFSTQADLAFVLGVHRVTIADRERGKAPIDGEAELALRHLVECEDGASDE
jgi:DNA-binding XRE family transcriptional regulator